MRKLPPEFVAPLTPVNQRVHRCGVSREDASHRILIMRAGAFGDILMGTPLLAALREAYPHAHLTWIVEHKEAQAIDANPYIDEYLRWDGSYWRGMLRRGLFPIWLVRALGLQRELRRRHYDIFISFQPEEWPLLVRGVGAKTSIGVFDTFRQFSQADRTSPHTRLYTAAYVQSDLPLHRTDQYLLPLKALGLSQAVSRQMSMGFTAEDDRTVQTFLTQNGVTSDERLVVLAPMTTWPSRCWPAERYVTLGDRLAQDARTKLVLIGSTRETAVVEGIAARMQTRPITATGVLTFRQIAALIAGAAALVSGDTGPMHVAAAVGTPFVALFGPTPADGRAPLAGRGAVLLHPVPCGPCDQKVCPNQESPMLCMRLISVEEVQAAVEMLLQRSESGVAPAR